MEVLRTAILDMLRLKKGESFNSSEVVRQMYPQDWEQFLEEVNTEIFELYREGLLSIDEAELDSSRTTSLRISSPNKL